jgi:mRNA interferase RelE/StbE
MTYNLAFLQSAQKEWDKLPIPLKQQFKKKLIERLEEPHVPKSQLSGMKNCYKIKLRDSGYRLVYRVIEDRIVVQVIAIGRRDKNKIYQSAMQRFKNLRNVSLDEEHQKL